MPFQSTGLNRLLKVIYASPPLRHEIIRKDAYEDYRKPILAKRNKILSQQGVKIKRTGGDFYSPFWRDARSHIMGEVDLPKATKERIEKSKISRRKLYPTLLDGFLSWWQDKRRLSNLPFIVRDDNLSGHCPITEDISINIKEVIFIEIDHTHKRVIYPYFCAEHALTDEGARIGLWSMSQSLGEHDIKDFRIIDVFRSQSHSILDTPLQGNEEDILRRRVLDLVQEWKLVRSNYG